MKKFTALCLALLMATVAGLGSVSLAETSEPVSGKVTIWGWTDEPEFFTAFEAAYPGTDIEFVIVDAGEYLTKIQSTLSSGGKLPDILWGEVLSRGKLFDMGILEDLSQPPYSFDKASVDPSIWPTLTNESGQVLGLEWSMNPAGLAYRRDLSDKYLGTSEPADVATLFATWDDFIAKGKEVVAASEGKTNMFPSLGDVYYIINGQAKTPRISNGVINKAAALELFANIVKFRDAGIVGKIDQWTPAWFANFSTDESIFHPIASWGIMDFIQANDASGEGRWGMIVPPGGAFSWGGTSWSITKTSENKALAWEVCKWMNLGGGNEIKKDQGFIPIVSGTAADPFYSQREEKFFANQKVTEMFVKDMIPTIHVNQITAYDMADIMAMELVLSSLNADYSITAEKATELYLEEMANQAPELTVQ